MSLVVELPQHLLIVFLSAVAGSSTPGSQRAIDNPAPFLRQVASHGSENPYRLAPQPFFDALSNLKGDRRFAHYASRVFKTSSGEAYVPVAREAKEMLALRRNSVVARYVAESYARANSIAISQAMGRPATVADLLLAHRFGLRFAIDLRRAEVQSPDTLVAVAVPGLNDVEPDAVFAGDHALRISDVMAGFDRVVVRAMAALPRQAVVPQPPVRRPAVGAVVAGHAAKPDATRIMGWHAQARQMVDGWSTRLR